MISLLHCLGKIVEKFVVEQFALYFKIYSKLDLAQISICNKRSANNAVSVLVDIIQESWKKKKLAKALFIDVKEAFNNVSKIWLFKRMIEQGIDRDLVA